MRHIISLTTIPPRLDRIGETLRALVAQRSRPEEVRLYLPKTFRRFPAYGGAVPDLPEGVTLIRPEEDLGPATKVIHAARDLRGQAVDILYCDDDHLYLRDWAEKFLAVRKRRPQDAVTGAVMHVRRSAGQPEPEGPRAVAPPPRLQQPGHLLRRLASRLAHRGAQDLPLEPIYRTVETPGYVDIAQGFTGVAIRPDFLDDQVFDIPPILWTVDDIWLSGHMARLGVKIWAEPRMNRFRQRNGPSATSPLYDAEIEGMRRRSANAACIAHMQEVYGVWGGVT